MAWQAGVRGEEGDRIGGEWITWGIANKSVKYCRPKRVVDSMCCCSLSLSLSPSREASLLLTANNLRESHDSE